MTLTEIIETFKTKLNVSYILNSLEKAADFYNESDNDSERNDPGETLKNSPYSSLASNFANSPSAVRISKNKEEQLIKLTDV